MIETINNEITEFKSVLTNLPENTIANRNKKKSVIDLELKNREITLNAIKEEIISRASKISSLKENKQIKKIDEDIEKCKIMHEWNSYNSPYEKMHIDYYLYQLHRYYKNDLSIVNKCILNIIESFKKVGINLTHKDFSYNKCAREYIELLIQDPPKKELEALFERLYWKFPEILTTIELNFKGIYLANERKIEKYYQVRKEEYTRNHKLTELEKLNIELHEKKENILETDPYVLLQKFLTKKLNIHDFTEINYHKKMNQYYPNGNYSNIIARKLLHTLKQYNLILNSEYLLEDMKKKLEEKVSFKGKKTAILKEIKGLEKKIISVNKTICKEHKFFKFGKRDEKLIFQYKENLKKLETKMNELEEANFNDVILKELSKDSSILEVFKFICANYLYYVNRTKERDANISVASLSKGFKELQELIYNNDFTLINHLALLEEKNLQMVIADKFKLENINLTMEDLEKDNLPNTINNISFLIDYDNLIKSSITAEDISFYLQALDKKELFPE